jgi:hypothetical protein
MAYSIDVRDPATARLSHRLELPGAAPLKERFPR